MTASLKPPIVVNKSESDYDVYIGRGSLWGNPFVIGIDGNRYIVIKKYREWLIRKMKSNEIRPSDLLSLSGKILGCHCKPKSCHGDVIVEIFNKFVEHRTRRSENQNNVLKVKQCQLEKSSK